ncbi:serine/threonine protein phosphatase 1 [Pontibacter ummariensis]|uniref:Serine/threonine protein phosphatase 1 n=1 Tax=Pontibacter ummariensis TaxID=1610492 RepID=A0A239CM01_9BACT|nr:metallophosphoesterase family protein [Pontibacter ummariensis]PRY14956.1 serine/threonine protein phosphatase 1 [Pontibacter ummariensis]SNS20768.1 serine/threonine protein phosphatase 1 [Pontibacter ummariensis]
MARYALTDLHGCSQTLKALIEQLKLQKTDELYLLGDFVNKGPDSKGVIDFILHLQKQHYQVQCLRGNHDQMLLKSTKKGAAALKLTPAEQELTLQSFDIKHFESLPAKYVSFLKGLPYYLELPDYYLVHAGFDFKQKDIFQEADAMLNIRDYKVDWERLDNKRLLHGHTPTALHSIKKGATHQEQKLNLDAGCVYYKNAALGNLVALDLDSQELFVQPNEDRPYPVARKS